MFCPKCGNEINEGYEYCEKCGNKIVINNNQSNDIDINIARANAYKAKKKERLTNIIILSVLGIIIVACLSVYFIYCHGKDFRNVNWGMTAKEVIEIEDNLPLDTSNRDNVLYKIKDFDLINNCEVGLVYTFKNDSLKIASVMVNRNDYTIDEILHIYERKYGDYKLKKDGDEDIYVWEKHRYKIVMLENYYSKENEYYTFIAYIDPKSDYFELFNK